MSDDACLFRQGEQKVVLHNWEGLRLDDTVYVQLDHEGSGRPVVVGKEPDALSVDTRERLQNTRGKAGLSVEDLEQTFLIPPEYLGRP